MQTKLSVALAATLAGFALSAQAANVEVYGLIDTGLNYQHVDADRAGVDDVSKFQMKSSQSTPNRWGLRGTEEIGKPVRKRRRHAHERSALPPCSAGDADVGRLRHARPRALRHA